MYERLTALGSAHLRRYEFHPRHDPLVSLTLIWNCRTLKFLQFFFLNRQHSCQSVKHLPSDIMTADLAHFRRQVTESLLKLQRAQCQDNDDVVKSVSITTPAGSDSGLRPADSLSPSKTSSGDAALPHDGAVADQSRSRSSSMSDTSHAQEAGTRLPTMSPTNNSKSRDERRARRNCRSRRAHDDAVLSDDVRNSATPEIDLRQAVAAAAAIQSKFTSFFVADILGLSSTNTSVSGNDKLIASSGHHNDELRDNDNGKYPVF